jgi:pimeloyl-ACP methyl ester carboxylesterase
MTPVPPTRPVAAPDTLSCVVTDGDSRMLVLLHGIFMDASLWDHVRARLPGMRTIRLDMPSHGTSPDMPRGATLNDHVTLVEATLDAQGVSAAVVVGHSWGGMVGLRLAHRRPDLVAGLVLSNTPLLRVRGLSRLGFHAQRLLLAAGLPSSMYGRMASRALIGSAHRRAHRADVSELANRARRMGRGRLRETLRSVLLEPGDALDLTYALSMPWTAVAGDDDYVLADGVRGALDRRGRLRTTHGAHTTPVEDPETVSIAVRDILSQLPPTLPSTSCATVGPRLRPDCSPAR